MEVVIICLPASLEGGGGGGLSLEAFNEAAAALALVLAVWALWSRLTTLDTLLVITLAPLALLRMTNGMPPPTSDASDISLPQSLPEM